MVRAYYLCSKSAVTKAFQVFVNRLYGCGQLDRVVVNKCYTVLDSDRSFRLQIVLVGRVMRGL